MILKLVLCLILFVNIFDETISRSSNNACKNFEDYFNVTNNQNCFYDPDMLLETVSLLIYSHNEP
jgi:hypothetical protein